MISAEDDLATYLAEWNAGNGQARDTLLTLAYGELRSLAASYLSGERSAPALDPEALVHETYLRLASQKLPDWEPIALFRCGSLSHETDPGGSRAAEQAGKARQRRTGRGHRGSERAIPSGG